MAHCIIFFVQRLALRVKERSKLLAWVPRMAAFARADLLISLDALRLLKATTLIQVFFKEIYRLKTFLIKRRFLVLGSLIVLCPLLALLTLSVAIASRAAHAASSTTSVPALYELRTDGSIWQYTGTPLTGWQEIGAPNTQTSGNGLVATTSQVYQLQLNGDILVYSGTSTTWTTLDASGTAQEIALSSTGQLYKQDLDGTAWQYAGGTTWTQLSSAANSGPLGARSLYAGPDGALYSIGATGVWEYTGTPITGWKEIDNTTIPSAVPGGQQAAANLLATTSNGRLYELRYNAQTITPFSVWAYVQPIAYRPVWVWQQIGTQASSLVGNSNLYQVDSGGTIQVYNFSWGFPLATTWTSLNNPSPAQISGFAASSSDQVFESLKTGAVWMLDSGTWTQIDDSTTVWGITSDMGGIGINSVG